MYFDLIKPFFPRFRNHRLLDNHRVAFEFAVIFESSNDRFRAVQGKISFGLVAKPDRTRYDSVKSVHDSVNGGALAAQVLEVR